jgi:hypothetical protein
MLLGQQLKLSAFSLLAALSAFLTIEVGTLWDPALAQRTAKLCSLQTDQRHPLVEMG